ncbi:hypothetical protein BDZ45DRAFT_672395 [Acephala macrosclerotiorum]|nr:hypothetical protein BDZ45DRAFT_672395 [Acephala macrosclerotiorum]
MAQCDVVEVTLLKFHRPQPHRKKGNFKPRIYHLSPPLLEVAIKFCKIMEVAAEVRQRTDRMTAAMPPPTRNRKSTLRRNSGGGDEDEDKNKEGDNQNGDGGEEKKADQGNNIFGLRVSLESLQELLDEIPTGLDGIRAIPSDAPIFQLCKIGDLQGIQKPMTNDNASLYDVNDQGKSLLHLALSNEHPDICKFLIEDNATSDVLDDLKMRFHYNQALLHAIRKLIQGYATRSSL